MTSRKAVIDATDDEERPNKRQRFGGAIDNDGSDSSDVAAIPRPSLDDINDDCLLLIMSYLPTDDLSNIAMCGRSYRKVRHHESLDQRRAPAQLILREGSSFNDVVNAIIRNGWNQSLLRGNQTSLDIIGIERLRGVPDLMKRKIARSKLTGIKHLTLKRTPNVPNHIIDDGEQMWPFSFLFPNLLHANIVSPTRGSVSASTALCTIDFFRENCPNLTQFEWRRGIDIFALFKSNYL